MKSWGDGEHPQYSPVFVFMLMRVHPPGDLLIAPLWSIGASILQGFQDQQVTFPVAEQQVCISPTCSIQKTFYSLERQRAP